MDNRCCATCGQPLPAAGAGDDPIALLRRLEVDPGNLQVYRIDRSQDWAVTQTRGVRFTRRAVMALVQAGKLSSVYPGLPGADECYGLSSYYASESYLADLAYKIERSKGRRAKAPAPAMKQMREGEG